MNIREAILRAAKRIEDEPSSYNWGRTSVPYCGTTACMWGWIGFELGLPHGLSNIDVAKKIGVQETHHLYKFCIEQDGQGHFQREGRLAALAAAIALRKYADRYFPAPKVERNFARELMANLPKEPIPAEA